MAHLLEVHPDWIVEDVELLVRLDFLFVTVSFITLLILVAVNLRGVDDIELHIAQTLHDRLDIIRVDEIVGQNLVDVVVG